MAATHHKARPALKSIHPKLNVVPFTEFLRQDCPPKARQYAAQHPLGKKLAVLQSLALEEPAIYADSDILFFSAAQELARLVETSTSKSRYLLDCWPSLDGRLLKSEAEKALPLNSGFLIFHHALDWTEANARLEAMSGDPSFFTEQTVAHLAVRADGGEPLPPDRYVMQNDDQWRYEDAHARRPIVLRHYIGSFRHKMWLQTRW